jgi:hypothetical protein
VSCLENVNWWKSMLLLRRISGASSAPTPAIGTKSSIWLIDYFLFYVPLKNFSLIWRRHHCRWRKAKFRPMLLWAGRDLYFVTPTVTRDLGFIPVSSEGLPHSVASLLTTSMGMRRIYSNPDPHGSLWIDGDFEKDRCFSFLCWKLCECISHDCQEFYFKKLSMEFFFSYVDTR